ncbi:MAG: hypothetical protein M0Z39_05795 [Actinomycetota bacterium]|nr:hypothetical protein [Actinomycetota bacterium]
MNRVGTQKLVGEVRDYVLETVIRPYFDLHRKRGSNLVRIEGSEWRHLIATTAGSEGVFLVWNGLGGGWDFTGEVYNTCAEEAERAGLKPFYHVFAGLYLYQTENVRFYMFDLAHGVLGTVQL